MSKLLSRILTALGLSAKPVDVNPTGNARDDRRRARAARLREAIDQGDGRAELRDELKRLEQQEH